MKILKSLIKLDIYVDNDVKKRDHCHVNGKYRASEHRDCNIKSLIKQS